MTSNLGFALRAIEVNVVLDQDPSFNTVTANTITADTITSLVDVIGQTSSFVTGGFADIVTTTLNATTGTIVNLTGTVSTIETTIVPETGSLRLGSTAGGGDNKTYPPITMKFTTDEAILKGEIVVVVNNAGNPVIVTFGSTDQSYLPIAGIAAEAAASAGIVIDVIVGGSFEVLLDGSAVGLGASLAPSITTDGRARNAIGAGTASLSFGVFGTAIEAGSPNSLVRGVFTHGSAYDEDIILKDVLVRDTGKIQLGTTSGGGDGVTYPPVNMLFTAGEALILGNVLKMIDDGAGNPVVVKTIPTDSGLVAVVGCTNESALSGADVEVAVGGVFTAQLAAGESVSIGDNVRRSAVVGQDGLVDKSIGGSGTATFGFSMTNTAAGGVMKGLFFKNETT